jgi:hypothetical protein
MLSGGCLSITIFEVWEVTMSDAVRFIIVLGAFQFVELFFILLFVVEIGRDIGKILKKLEEGQEDD